MSQRSRRTQARSLNGSQSQSSENSRRSTQRAASPPDENYDEYTVATVKFILNHLATKYPIKRADIVKECCNGNTKIFTIILSVVQNHLKSVSFSVDIPTIYKYNSNTVCWIQVYGIIFEEVKSSKASKKEYICTSHIPQISLLQLKKSDRKDHSLLLLILSYIFVKGTCIGEGKFSLMNSNVCTTSLNCPCLHQVCYSIFLVGLALTLTENMIILVTLKKPQKYFENNFILSEIKRCQKLTTKRSKTLIFHIKNLLKCFTFVPG